MFVDPIAGVPGDLGHDGPQAMIVDVPGPTTTGADDVVMVLRVARDIGVLAGRQVQSFDRLDLDQEVERPEDRRPSEAEAAATRLDDEIRGREVPVLLGDESGDGTPRFRSPVAGLLKRSKDGRGVHHAVDRSRV